MLYPNSILKVSDNSGARLVKCLQFSGNSKQKIIKIGSFSSASLKKGKLIAKGFSSTKVYWILIFTVHRKYSRVCGRYIHFESNKALLYNRKMSRFIGDRIYGFGAKELTKSVKNSQIKTLVSHFF